MLTAGGLRPSGGRMRGLAVSFAAVAALAVAIGAVLTVIRGAPPELSALERTLDPRTDGQKAVEAAQRRLDRAPNDPRAMAGLASAYLQRQRETGDPIFVTKAGDLIARATAAGTSDPGVAVAAAAVANSAHDFAAGLRWSELAVRLAPASSSSYGVLTDALVELGRYDEAVAAAQRMVDLRPDLASLTRVSYLRELHGDVDGAIDAMRRALASSAPRGEPAAWTEVQLGHLHFARGDIADAQAAYESALRRSDGFAHALGGLGRVRAARGDLRGAIALYERAADRLPVPEIVAALGDLRAATGDLAGAEREYALVGAMDRILAASGVRTDVDISLFFSDRAREPQRALAAARVEYERRGASIHVALALAWAEHRAGDLEAAARHGAEAMRLGSREPLMLYRAGAIAHDAGQLERARELLEASAAANGRASVLFDGDLARRLRVLARADR